MVGFGLVCLAWVGWFGLVCLPMSITEIIKPHAGEVTSVQFDQPFVKQCSLVNRLNVWRLGCFVDNVFYWLH